MVSSSTKMLNTSILLLTEAFIQSSLVPIKSPTNSKASRRYTCSERFLRIYYSFCFCYLYYYITYVLVHRCGASGSMRACHAEGSGSIPGRDRFPRWGIFVVFPHLWDKCQETLGPRGPRISFGRRNPHSIFALLGWLRVCLVCIVFHVCAVSEVAPALGWSLIRGDPPCPCVVKKVCMWYIV